MDGADMIATCAAPGEDEGIESAIFNSMSAEQSARLREQLERANHA
jgi:hypothetical protein